MMRRASALRPTGAGVWPALLALVLLSGCASTAPNGPSGSNARNPADPFEGWNRQVYAFNESVDATVLKPVAETYRDVVPELVRKGVSNVLGNIGDVWSAANQVLQGKLQLGVEMGMRVLTNTVFGLGGLLDPATEMGLTRRSEDFGQTLGVWGVGNGPFLILPLLGPSTLRDTGGLLVDREVSAAELPSKSSEQAAVTLLELVNLRAALLSTTDLLDRVALDKYSFTRDAYLSRRRDQVFDGAPPMDIFDDEDYGDPPAAPGTAASAPAPSSPASPASSPASAPASSAVAAPTTTGQAVPAAAPATTSAGHARPVRPAHPQARPSTPIPP